ncbi:MAG: O-Antigen polymerase family [Microgenomates group bacterium GW2011_GWC1_41_8]|uniref:O-antigen ligase-related domain-containing protein n=2 Tax=Candidatus Roizmaniibacteriota TaxID=1752723 RepID=A0A0G0UZV6_9BACT|nr:MAG: hypothetical protein UU41_C0012G0035 [Candidatus Roizmanbacteria bacterium GW2011_GWA1_41_13]KKS22389.1 MAG: O-Antigen polymerase family [Microgenomates group bacterium GW2011_GWC1_41_8]OGK50342.1 MAG: hypothetical protein A3A55_01440 [Candidatus Roizmanbacteria bacterium RIFCSPLOWO2_01_FULL_40_14]
MEHRTRDKLLSNFNNLHRWLFYLLLLLIPTQLGYHFWPDFAFVNGIRVDYLAPTIYLTDLLILGIGISWLLSKITNDDLPARNASRNMRDAGGRITQYRILIAGILFFIFNLLFSDVSQLTLLNLLTILKLTFIAVYIVKTKPDLKISSGYLLVASGYSSLIAWIQFINQSSIGGLLWFLGERTFDVTTPGIATAIMNNKLILRPYATFPHPNVLAGFITVLLPLVFFNTSVIVRKVKLPLLIFFLATLFITFSRSAWMVAGILLTVVLISNLPAGKAGQHYLRIRNRNRVAWILVAIILIILLPFLSERIANLSSVDIQSVTRRMDLNYAALNMMKDNPIFGVGLNNFLVALPSYTTIDSYQDLQPAHNIYLLLLAEWGVVGSAMVIFLLIKLLFSTSYKILLPLVALLLLGLFDHYPYTIHQIQLLFAVLVGFTISLKHEIY